MKETKEKTIGGETMKLALWNMKEDDALMLGLRDMDGRKPKNMVFGRQDELGDNDILLVYVGEEAGKDDLEDLLRRDTFPERSAVLVGTPLLSEGVRELLQLASAKFSWVVATYNNEDWFEFADALWNWIWELDREFALSRILVPVTQRQKGFSLNLTHFLEWFRRMGVEVAEIRRGIQTVVEGSFFKPALEALGGPEEEVVLDLDRDALQETINGSGVSLPSGLEITDCLTIQPSTKTAIDRDEHEHRIGVIGEESGEKTFLIPADLLFRETEGE